MAENALSAMDLGHLQEKAWNVSAGNNSPVQVEYLPTGGAENVEYLGDVADSPAPSRADKAAYAKIRAWTDEQIIQTANNTGLDEDVVRAAHQHQIVDTHTITLGNVQYEGWFSPYFADAWNGALEGTLTDREIDSFRNMIAHEWVEDQMEAFWRANGLGDTIGRLFQTPHMVVIKTHLSHLTTMHLMT